MLRYFIVVTSFYISKITTHIHKIKLYIIQLLWYTLCVALSDKINFQKHLYPTYYIFLHHVLLFFFSYYTYDKISERGDMKDDFRDVFFLRAKYPYIILHHIWQMEFSEKNRVMWFLEKKIIFFPVHKNV